MIKKKLFILVFLLTILSAGFVLAEDIGYIVKTAYPLDPTNYDEPAIISLLESNNHTVYFLDDSDTINPDLYDLIIVGEDVQNIDGVFDNKYKKTLFLSSTAAKNAGLSQYSGTTTNNKIEIIDNIHKITNDFREEEIIVYSPSSKVNYVYGCKATNSETLAYKLYESKATILALREDSLLLKDGLCTKRIIQIYERNLFFGLPQASSWNSDARELFINSIEWLLTGEDRDGDGHYYYDDCDDEDSDKYQILEGYADNDFDSYGTGNLISVCSGDNLPEEYSVLNTDCDDSVDSCNLNCFSLSYLDSDNDSYGDLGIYHRTCDAPSDYVLNSDDCNDTNSEINPSALEIQYDLIDSNCDNSAELSSEINDLFWNEESNLTLNLDSYVWNPNNNELSFYVYSNSYNPYISIINQEKNIFNFSSEKDYNGEDQVIFAMYDENTNIETLTNKITLTVLPVNDAPDFLNNIENITWNEDNNLTNYLDLNDYFYDLENNELSFSVLGNAFINIILDNGLVSFYPDKDWFGSEKIKFTATDGEYTSSSNEITLTVNDANEPPQFKTINCQTQINEDQEYECELNASDSENDLLTFSVKDENDLKCTINGNKLKYKSDENYNGDASCLIKVSDLTGYDTYLLETKILAVNDAPLITDYSPKGVIKLMENTDKSFSITASDIDEDILKITWFLDSLEVGSGSSYIFNNSQGNYNLTAVVTDDIAEPITKTFNVFVGNVSDFTCEEVGGYVLEQNQICLGELLGVKDIITCCSVKGSPKFSKISRCTAFNQNINIEIKEPDENTKFTIGEKIDFNIEVENNLNNDFDFDIETYLYDLTKDKKIESYKDSLDIDNGDMEEINSDFEIEENLDESHEYVIFVKASESKDESYCNEQYVLINIERAEHNIIIENFEITPSTLVCGDYFNIDVNLKNKGTSDEDVYLLVENSELGFKEQTPEFELEKYNDKDSTTKIFTIKSSEKLNSGEYSLKLTAIFDDGDEKSSLSKTISIECKQIEQKTQEIQKISLKTEKQNVQTTNSHTKIFFGVSLFFFIILLGVIFLFRLVHNLNKSTGGKNDNKNKV